MVVFKVFPLHRIPQFETEGKRKETNRVIINKKQFLVIIMITIITIIIKFTTFNLILSFFLSF